MRLRKRRCRVDRRSCFTEASVSVWLLGLCVIGISIVPRTLAALLAVGGGEDDLTATLNRDASSAGFCHCWLRVHSDKLRLRSVGVRYASDTRVAVYFSTSPMITILDAQLVRCFSYSHATSKVSAFWKKTF